MNIIITEEKFLPHRGCHISLVLDKNKVNLIKGVNGIGKSTLASYVKEHFFDDVTLIEQSPLCHFYNRQLIDIKNIFINARPVHFSLESLNFLWNVFELEKISQHTVHQLSGGENQSLKLTLGLSVKNKVIIIDEPSQYLDDGRKEKLSIFLNKLIKDHYVVVIEHESSWLSALPQKSAELYIENDILKAKYV
ncbi:MAG TPA: ABC transporter ATP-binding protein [Bacteriovoracaceae bacterium]|nr:ABC transporter ATP-binding protein [Bacteriovoracaceae bacterium]